MHDRDVVRLRADVELRLAMRELTLRTERLSELTTDELHRVAGAAVPNTLKVAECVRTLRGCTTAITCPVPETP